MFLESANFKKWFPEIDHFPRPDWKAIDKFIRTNSTEDHWEDAWREIARIWLEKTRKCLDRSYNLDESENFHLLSDLQPKSRSDLLSFVEGARARMLSTLADIPLPKEYGKHVILRFARDHDYYRYVSYFDPEGEHASSIGQLVNSGYTHIAFHHFNAPGADKRVLVHELTHNLLNSLPLPSWLNEALAMLFERDLAGGRQPAMTRDLAAQHKAYWNSKTIQEFWRGESFGEPEGQELAYGLAGILLDFIVTDVRPAPADFRDFVLNADYEDAGTAAARNYLGVELSDLVSAFLGPGQWAPAP